MVGSTFILRLENEEERNTVDSAIQTLIQETPKAPSLKRKHRKLPEFSVTDSLLKKQVDLLQEQLQI